MRPHSSQWETLINYSHTTRTVIESYRPAVGDVAVPVPISSGSIDFDDTGHIKRVLRVTVPAETDGRVWDPGDDILAPLNAYGQRLHVSTGIQLPDGSWEMMDLGHYLITEWERNEEDGTVEVIAQDLSRLISDDRLMTPQTVPRGATFASEFARLLNGNMPYRIDASVTDRAISAGMVWEREREKNLNDLCDSWGTRWRINDRGQAQVSPDYADIRMSTPVELQAVSGNGGSIVTRNRHVERGTLYNSVVVTGKATTSGWAPFASEQIDPFDDPLSVYGPYGRVVRFFSSELITTDAQARQTAKSLLARWSRVGRAEGLTVLPNPAVELGDVARVATESGWFLGRVVAMSIPLTPGDGPMALTVSNRPDEIAGE